jgi:hypothetical protein
MVISRFESLERLIKDEFRTVNNRLGAVEKQTRITNGRVTELEHAGITKEAVSQAIDELHEMHEQHIDRWWQRFVNAATGVAAIFGILIVIVADIIYHHIG